MRNAVILYEEGLALAFSTSVMSYLCSPVPQNVMEQFNPGLRNLVNLGKTYEKSVTSKHSLQT